ncbi:unnamed protein product [Discosporangium mesarthrocarpum]
MRSTRVLRRQRGRGNCERLYPIPLLLSVGLLAFRLGIFGNRNFDSSSKEELELQVGDFKLPPAFEGRETQSDEGFVDRTWMEGQSRRSNYLRLVTAGSGWPRARESNEETASEEENGKGKGELVTHHHVDARGNEWPPPRNGNLGNDHGTYRTLTVVREGSCVSRDCRVLITGCGRSGTHFVAEQFMSSGIPILHEQIGEAGTVSWVHGAPYSEENHELEAWFSNRDSAGLRASPDFSFFPVFHLVRHPLDTISSLTECFCGCGHLSCGGWADPPSWKWAGRHMDFSNKLCTKVRESVCVGHSNKLGGRLIRSMEYWLGWNQMVAAQAHYRTQLEQVDLSEVVAAAPLLAAKSRTSGGKVEQKSFSSKRLKGRSQKKLTWKDLREADPALEAQVWELAQSYGYSRWRKLW